MEKIFLTSEINENKQELWHLHSFNANKDTTSMELHVLFVCMGSSPFSAFLPYSKDMLVGSPASAIVCIHIHMTYIVSSTLRAETEMCVR